MMIRMKRKWLTKTKQAKEGIYKKTYWMLMIYVVAMSSVTLSEKTGNGPAFHRGNTVG